MAKEVSGATINMSGRKGSRKRTQTKRFVQENELVSKSKSKTSTQPKLPSARGRGRPRQRARGATGGNLGISPPLLQDNEAMNGIHEENGDITVAQGTHEEGIEEQSQSTSSVDMTIPDVNAALQTTREEIAEFMTKVTGVLTALFSVITAPQVSEMENSHVKEIEENDLLNNYINHAKSVLVVKENSYKNAVLRGSRSDARGGGGGTKATNSPVDITHSPESITQNHTHTSQRDSQTMPPRPISDAEHEWKIKFDEKRKKNIIVHGMYDANSYAEDMSFIRHMFRDIGCRENYSQISRLTRLGTRRYNRNRTLMICFDTEEAATHVLNKCKDLSNSRTYGRLNIKRDLPRDQRQVNNRSGNEIYQASRGAQSRDDRRDGQRVHGEKYRAIPARDIDIDDNNAETADESEDEHSSSGSDLSAYDSSDSEWTTVDDTEWVSENRFEDNISNVGATGTANVQTEEIASHLAGLRTSKGLEAAINVVGLTPQRATNIQGEIVVDEIRAEIHSEDNDVSNILSGEENSKRDTKVKTENPPSGNGEPRKRRGED